MEFQRVRIIREHLFGMSVTSILIISMFYIMLVVIYSFCYCLPNLKCFSGNSLYEQLDFFQKENLRLRVKKANLEQDVVDMQRNSDGS